MANFVLADSMAFYGTGLSLDTRWVSTGGGASFVTAFGGQAVTQGNGGSGGLRYRQWSTAVSSGTANMAVRVNAVSGVTGRPGIVFMSDATFMFGIEFQASGVILLWRLTGHSAGTVLATSDVNKYTIDTEHYMELEFEIHDTTGRLSLYVDNVLAVQATGADTRNGTPTTVNRIGFGISSTNGQSITFGHIAIYDTSTRLGPRKFSILRPTADTADKDFTRSTGSDNYALVDDSTVDATDYVIGSTVGDLDLYTMGNLSVTPTTIDLVQVNMIGSKTDATGRNIAGVVDVSGSQLQSSDMALAGTVTGFTHDFTIKPAGGAWDATAVNAITAGPKVTV